MVAADGCQNVRVAHRARLHQVHAPAQQCLQISLGAKNCVEPRLNARRKLHQKIGVAVRRVKVIGPRSRTKHLQPLNAVALADGSDVPLRLES